MRKTVCLQQNEKFSRQISCGNQGERPSRVKYILDQYTLNKPINKQVFANHSQL